MSSALLSMMKVLLESLLPSSLEPILTSASKSLAILSPPTQVAIIMYLDHPYWDQQREYCYQSLTILKIMVIFAACPGNTNYLGLWVKEWWVEKQSNKITQISFIEE